MTAPTITLPNDLEILIQRDFAAPPHLVFRAWTEPDLVRRWWAGRRGVMQSCEMDFRVGGTYRHVLEAHSSGQEVAFHGEFLEIEPGVRFVQTEVFEGAPPSDGPDVVNVIAFVPTPRGTRLELLVQAPTREIRDLIAGSGMEVGMNEQMEILDALLPTLG